MSSRGTLRDERGAMLLISLFFAIFAVALVYSLVGTAQAVFFREHLQDAADQAALSGAVMHARSMNLLVLTNIVMAALLAILVTVKLLEALATIGIAVAAAVAWITGGASLGVIPPLKVVRADMQEAYRQAKPPVYDALGALHDVADAIKTAAPVAANGVVLADIATYSSPLVEAGFAGATRSTLPVEDDAFKVLCQQAGTLPGKVAHDALEKIHFPDLVMEPISDAMGSLSGSFSNYFCGEDGDSGAAPPAYPQQVKRTYPRMSPTIACENEDSGGDGSAPVATATTPTCDASLRFGQDAEPDGTTGNCQEGRNCSATGPYEQSVAQARVECDPAEFPPPFRYLYQTVRGTVVYSWTGQFWKRGEPNYATPVKRDDDASIPPCGAANQHPSVAVGYNTLVRREGSESVLPVCTTESPPAFESRLRTGEERSVTFTEVRHILGCVRNEVVQVQVKNDAAPEEGGSSRSSKRLEMATKLGDENFQIRAILRGAALSSVPERIVQFALWRQPAPEQSLGALRDMARFSVAQAEYFYDGTDSRDAWMWNMNWRARLRRFALPESDALDRLRDSCHTHLGTSSDAATAAGVAGSVFNGDCDSLFDLLARFEHVLSH